MPRGKGIRLAFGNAVDAKTKPLNDLFAQDI
jgi:hypothetical protein